MGLLYDYHFMLTIGFVKVANETVEKPLIPHLQIPIYDIVMP